MSILSGTKVVWPMTCRYLHRDELDVVLGQPVPAGQQPCRHRGERPHLDTRRA
jgi:hypothetical protein